MLLLCVATLSAASWSQRSDLFAQPVSLDAGALRDASTDARADTGVRCFPLRESDEERDEEAPRDAGSARDASATSDAGCALPRTVIDREGHCCLPGQSWRASACAGAPSTCAPGETRGEENSCVRRSSDDAGASARLFEAPTARAPAGMIAVPGAVMRLGAGWASVGPFAIDRAEVSAASYDRCVSAGVCLATPGGFEASRATSPAVNVSWEMARCYCGWVGARLPSEAEWELASRGVDGRRYPWGERAPDCTLARHAGCGDAPLRIDAAPAGRSVFGLVDTAGNVAEWVGDVYAPRSARDDGRVAQDPTGPASGSQRVVRGGSFLSPPQDVSCDARRGVDAREQRSDVGFRCARGL